MNGNPQLFDSVSAEILFELGVQRGSIRKSASISDDFVLEGRHKQGVIAGILVGMISSLGWILLSADTFKDVYNIPDHLGYTPFSQPGIVTIPLGFLTLILVSLMTRKPATAA